MGEIRERPEEIDPLAIAAAAFRAACAAQRQIEDPERAAADTEWTTTDTAVQALYIECLRRNAGIPDEIAAACSHVLAMIIAQQPDPIVASEMTMNGILQHVLRFRRDLAAQDAAAAARQGRKPS